MILKIRLPIYCLSCNRLIVDLKHKNRKYCSYQCFGNSQIGKEVSLETRRKMSQNTSHHRLGKKLPLSMRRMGKDNPTWKGKTLLIDRLRDLREYTEWRVKVFTRDNYICQVCGKNHKREKSRYLIAHHEKSFSKVLFRRFLQDYSPLSPFDDANVLIKLALNYKPFWEVANGNTYCGSCHGKLEHSKRERDTRGRYK